MGGNQGNLPWPFFLAPLTSLLGVSRTFNIATILASLYAKKNFFCLARGKSHFLEIFMFVNNSFVMILKTEETKAMTFYFPTTRRLECSAKIPLFTNFEMRSRLNRSIALSSMNRNTHAF